jgi:adenylate cyclase
LWISVSQLQRVEEYNKKRVENGYVPIKIGIGIHVGHMMLGMVGEENRMQGDAFSDNVNLTARLEGLTKFYGVSLLISNQALENLSNPDKYQIRFLDRVVVKGRSEAISVYEVLDAEIDKIRFIKLQTQPDFEKGLEYYRQGNFDQAKDYFEKVLAINAADKTADLYLNRLNYLLQNGKPENWDGIWTFTEK